MTMLTLTRDDVRAVAHALMVLNGETTTLDVKEALRKKGFWAKQDQVREFMLDITQKDGDVAYRDDNGMYRTYYLTNSPLAVTSIPAQVSSWWLPVVPATPKVDPTPSPAKPSADAVLAKYYVTDQFGWSFREYSNVTRAQAKYRWSREVLKPYECARARKA